MKNVKLFEEFRHIRSLESHEEEPVIDDETEKEEGTEGAEDESPIVLGDEEGSEEESGSEEKATGGKKVAQERINSKHKNGYIKIKSSEDGTGHDVEMSFQKVFNDSEVVDDWKQKLITIMNNTEDLFMTEVGNKTEE